VQAGNPLPDAAGQAAALRMLDLLQDLAEQDLVICLLSGGGSALLSLPPTSIALADKRRVTQSLLITSTIFVRFILVAVRGSGWCCRLRVMAHPYNVVIPAEAGIQSIRRREATQK